MSITITPDAVKPSSIDVSFQPLRALPSPQGDAASPAFKLKSFFSLRRYSRQISTAILAAVEPSISAYLGRRLSLSRRADDAQVFRSSALIVNARPDVGREKYIFAFLHLSHFCRHDIVV